MLSHPLTSAINIRQAMRILRHESGLGRAGSLSVAIYGYPLLGMDIPGSTLLLNFHPGIAPRPADGDD